MKEYYVITASVPAPDRLPKGPAKAAPSSARDSCTQKLRRGPEGSRVCMYIYMYVHAVGLGYIAAIEIVYMEIEQ